jgi:glyceraldehyde-3-phosphate dehydrogenase/erythrose-4-phosphate dehydrogenase
MAKRIAINGFGRIGRCILRAMVERGVADVEVEHVAWGRTPDADRAERARARP